MEKQRNQISKPIKEGFTKGNTKQPSQNGRQAAPPPKPPKK